MRRSGTYTKVSSTRTKGPALLCKGIDDWLRPECLHYRALLVERPWKEGRDIQQEVDKLAQSGAFGEEESVEEAVELQGGMPKQRIALELSKKARRLAAFAVRRGLPKDLGDRIEQDLHEIGLVLTKMVPAAKQAILKLDIMGENGCRRWHRDNYVGRAVVTYNSRGTQYVDNAHVDMWKLEHGGSNAVIVRDDSQSCFTNVGDILFMKGQTFPAAANGLVHKSPQPSWHADGTVVNRLLLKVDLN